MPAQPAKTANRKAPNRIRFTRDELDKRRSVRPHRQAVLWDQKQPGLSLLVSRGPKHKKQATLTFRVVYYLPSAPGKPRYLALGRYPELDIEEARKQARRIRDDAEEGNNPKRKKLTGNVAEVVERYISEYAKPNHRSWEETARILNLYVVSKWADRNIEELDWKNDISPHLGELAQGKYEAPNGDKLGTPSVARSVRSHLVTLFNWYADEYSSTGFRSPIVKSRKTRLWKSPARERHLDDDEIRVLWTACNELNDAYAAVVQTALLTAQRFRKVGAMQRRDLKDHMRIPGRIENGQWIADEDVPNVWDATREDDPENKRVSIVPLSDMARKIIGKVPMIDADKGTDHIFTTTGRGPLRGWSKYKRGLDRKMLDTKRREAEAAGEDPDKVVLHPWQHRDLRRTARTLMARMAVSNEVAEHCLAHALPTIQATYNRYGYLREKRDAFDKLAQLIDRILHPTDNVAKLAGSKRRKQS